jgi:serine/threonine protein kinase
VHNGYQSTLLSPLAEQFVRAYTRLMNSAHDLLADPTGRAAASQQPVASWYTQGHSDGLGDRLLMFDNTGAASLELLRFKPELAVSPGFEKALRDSVQRLSAFRHPAFSQARSVQCLEGQEGLALISTHIPGKRLSEIFHRSERPGGMHPAFATWLIRQLAPALAEFHAQGPSVAHGALSADRIVLTPDRRLVIVEHVLGTALDERGRSTDQLWRDLGIIAIPMFNRPPRLDSRGDITQLGLIALSTLLGRRVTPNEYPEKLGPLLEEMADAAGRRVPAGIGPLRLWLERALTLDKGFASAMEASDALPELTQAPEPKSIEPPRAFEPLQLAVPSIDIPETSMPLRSIDVRETEPPVHPIEIPETGMKDRAPVSLLESREPISPQAILFGDGAPARRFLMARNIAAGLAVVALIQAVVIGRLMTRKAPAPPSIATVPVTIESATGGDLVMVDGRQVGVTPFQIGVGSAVHSIRVLSHEAAPAAAVPSPPSPSVPAANDARNASALALAAQRQRSGGLRLTSPIELQVLEGERVLGSSADGPIVASAGVHQLDFINTALGYRSRQTVNIRAGEIIPLKVQPPDGRVSINAQPWAQVWIDGNLVGETPLANLSVAAGEHEITFRHPQLGERRETTIVKSGAVTRISTSLNK